jgi:hypothetical protein
MRLSCNDPTDFARCFTMDIIRNEPKRNIAQKRKKEIGNLLRFCAILTTHEETIKQHFSSSFCVFARKNKFA